MKFEFLIMPSSLPERIIVMAIFEDRPETLIGAKYNSVKLLTGVEMRQHVISTLKHLDWSSVLFQA